jgi:hypothetical protein
VRQRAASGLSLEGSPKVRTLFITHKKNLNPPTVSDDVIHLRLYVDRTLPAIDDETGFRPAIYYIATTPKIQ